MGGLVLLLVVLALVGVAVRAPTRIALALVLGTYLLVPGIIAPPGAPGVLTVHRVVLVAALLGVARQCRAGALSWDVFRPPPVTARLALVVGLFAVLGVALAQPTTDLSAAARNWQAWLAQVLVVMGVAALCRASGSVRHALTVLVAAAGLAALVTFAERLTGASYARAWYHLVPSMLGTDPAQVLATRGGRVRVRGAADFTLAWAWSGAALVPVVLVTAGLLRGWRRGAALAVAGGLAVSVALTYSRGVVLPLLLMALVCAVVMRDRAVRIPVLASLALATVAALASTTLRSQFSENVDRGSIDVRVQRFPALTDLVAAHPFRGLGLSGLASLGFPTTDSSYLLAYGETGMLGLAALSGVLLCAVALLLRGARTAELPNRLVCTGVGLGAATLLVGAFTFDAFTTPSVAELFWALVAVGSVAAEGVPAARRELSWTVRSGAVAGLAVLGWVVAASAPAHAARTWQFETLDAYDATVFAPTYTGRQLRTSLCQVVQSRLDGTDVSVRCRESGVGPDDDAPGQGVLRVQAATSDEGEQLAEAAMASVAGVRQLRSVHLQSRGGWVTGTPSVLRTAPAWLPLLGLVVLLPTPRRRT